MESTHGKRNLYNELSSIKSEYGEGDKHEKTQESRVL